MKRIIVFVVLLSLFCVMMTSCASKKVSYAYAKIDGYSTNKYAVKCPTCGKEEVFTRGNGLKMYKCSNCDTQYDVDYSKALAYYK